MTKYEVDRMIASNRVTAELSLHDLEEIVKYRSDLWQYLMRLEYNHIDYKLKDSFLCEIIYIITDYAIFGFDQCGKQISVKIKD